MKSQGYCHLVVATMAILSFGAICRYSDVSRLKWGNIKLEKDLSSDQLQQIKDLEGPLFVRLEESGKIEIIK